ncbi:hypothetical protein [Brevundimonas sp.]|uniref:hypothetical protein n=1 Tax=Brevundimonas sp. TaxID=1871086 RepID=UPI002AB8C2B7|nr:hypothetical protein [Brevundimonas sp.]MDZ4363636.1 hypothetical protein [Brevundimonas sp.]
MQRFLSDLTGASTRWGRTILYGFVAARASITLVGIAVVLIWGEAGYDGFSGLLDQASLLVAIVAIAIAPLIEQLMVLFMVWVLAFVLRLPAEIAAVLTGLGFGTLHGLAPASLSVVPLFILLALIQIHWARRRKGMTGFWVGVAIHALTNATAVGTLFLLEGPLA